MQRFGLLVIGLLGATELAAATPELASPKPLDAVLGCRAIAEPSQRLACFDDRVQRLEAATARRDVVVVDRKEVQKERRSLFGFNIKDLGILGPGKDKGDPADREDTEISGTVHSARIDGEGNWVITLEDGAVWHQTEGGAVGRTPKAGTSVTIRRGSLGSYILHIDRGSGFKVRRES